MADRRIDQLTEAEDISDEDLFVIWKENISQTRSIKKGTMDLASKSYVNNSKSPDWENAEAITANQINAGYTVPVDGIIVGYMTSAINGHQDITVNGVVVACAYFNQANSDTSFANVNMVVNEGDLLKSTNIYASDTKCSFVPFKTPD